MAVTSTNLLVLKKSIESNRLGQDYADSLAWVHKEVYGIATGLFQQDFYLSLAHMIDREKTPRYAPLFSIAGNTVRLEKLFKESVLSSGSLSSQAKSNFKQFMPVYTQFAEQAYARLEIVIPNSPYFLNKNNPRATQWFQNAVEEIVKEKKGFQELFQAENPTAFETLFGICILKAMQSPTSQDLPEFFRSKRDTFRALGEQYKKLSEEEKNQLRRALLSLEESGNENVKELLSKISELHNNLKDADTPFYKGLFGTVVLLEQDKKKARESAPVSSEKSNSAPKPDKGCTLM